MKSQKNDGKIFVHFEAHKIDLYQITSLDLLLLRLISLNINIQLVLRWLDFLFPSGCNTITKSVCNKTHHIQQYFPAVPVDLDNDYGWVKLC